MTPNLKKKASISKRRYMTKRLFNLFLVATYLFATGAAALHTHDHGHSQHDEYTSTSEAYSHAGCTHHHPQQSGDPQNEPHEHAPDECVFCSFAGLQIDVATAPLVQSAGATIEGIVWSPPINPTPAAFDAWRQRGPPTV
jgi:hypothetical protein